MDSRNLLFSDSRASSPRGQPTPPVRRSASSGNGSGRDGGDPRQRNSRKIKTGSRWFQAIIMVIATIGLCLFLALFILQSANDLFGLNQEDQQFTIVVPKDATIEEIAESLTRAGVVEQELTFKLYAGLKYVDGDMKPGEYLLNSNMGYDEILVKLKTGDSQKEVVKLTFPEGRSVYEIAKELEENKVCDADAFLDCLQNDDLGFAFMDELPDDPNRFRRLEGYVFPDTYEFFVGEKVDSVARKFLRNFDSKINDLMRARMQEINMSLDDVITLASVIQKEAGGVGGIDEMKRVSSVFHNRLEDPESYPNLQSDVTMFYVNQYIIPFHDMRNQEMYDAYNTYVATGLPVGPICNPGLLAIEAAIYPTETPYYYFVTDVQEHFYYATTYPEHENNVARAARVEGEGEIHGTATTSD